MPESHFLAPEEDDRVLFILGLPELRTEQLRVGPVRGLAERMIASSTGTVFSPTGTTRPSPRPALALAQ